MGEIRPSPGNSSTAAPRDDRKAMRPFAKLLWTRYVKRGQMLEAEVEVEARCKK